MFVAEPQEATQGKGNSGELMKTESPRKSSIQNR